MTLNIHQRLHAVMQKCDYLQKEKKDGMRYKIVSHDKVTAYVRPVLVENGVIYYPVALNRSQNGNRTEIDLTVRFANIDDPNDHIDVVAAGYGVDDQDKGPGKAISYAVKYCLLKALGLETGDDPDETQDERAAHKPVVSPEKAQAQEMATKIAEAIKAAPSANDTALGLKVAGTGKDREDVALIRKQLGDTWADRLHTLAANRIAELTKPKDKAA